jgi:tetratricopeptide (TPR) repeat protein
LKRTGLGLAISIAYVLLLAGLVKGTTVWSSQPITTTQPNDARASITVDYPSDGSIFPPEFPPPTFIWHDPHEKASAWLIDVELSGGPKHLRVKSAGERMQVGEIDPRCVAETNQLPSLTPYQLSARTWTPDVEIWSTIKDHSLEQSAVVTITGFQSNSYVQAVSRGRVTVRTSKDPVAAPIFYRDVPLMPAANEHGLIQPLAPSALPLIAWRLMTIGKGSRVVMEKLHTCANCHSFSADGKTLGMDMDGPLNNKGIYALVPVHEETTIREENMIEWSTYRGKLGGRLRTAFMTQVSPQGDYVVATINDPGTESRERMGDIRGKYYLANFKDYRFLQVFYPTRGILAWYSKKTGHLKPLPGADDPRYVHTGAVWSPDGKYLVFARAEAKDPYPEGAKQAKFANDPNELQIQYDLCRIPFNNGRGGKAEPIAGASGNGMSNNFAKISPDGRWIVFVRCRNGQLMRPDSQLYIVPSEGGQARKMNCNLSPMNSWHSFSPNGRWMVFSSKGRSPYTQMFLTHLDKSGNDSPAILVEGATLANRAVNIPEFVNIPPDGLVSIDAPVTEFYRLFNLATELAAKGQYREAIIEWKKALKLSPEDARVHHYLGAALAGSGHVDEAIDYYRSALALVAEYPEANISLGVALAEKGQYDQAISHFTVALEASPNDVDAHNALGAAYIAKREPIQAIVHCKAALNINPDYAEARANLAAAMAMAGLPHEAIPHFEKALAANPDSLDTRSNLAYALLETGRREEAVLHLKKALELSPNSTHLNYYLGRTLVETGKPGEAIPSLEQAAQLSGRRDPVVLDALAVAYAEVDRFTEAVEAAEAALYLAKRQNNSVLVEALEIKITAFKTRTGTELNQ